MTELGPNANHSTVTYGNKSKAEVQGLDKVVVARDITLVNVMLVESLGYNHMYVVLLIRWTLMCTLLLIWWSS